MSRTRVLLTRVFAFASGLRDGVSYQRFRVVYEQDTHGPS